MKGSFDNIINGKTPVLVDFHAVWCGPCRAMPPILKSTKEALGDKVKIIKIDIDKNQMIASRFKVQSVPTLILFKNGSIAWRQSGVVPANALVNQIKDLV